MFLESYYLDLWMGQKLWIYCLGKTFIAEDGSRLRVISDPGLGRIIKEGNSKVKGISLLLRVILRLLPRKELSINTPLSAIEPLPSRLAMSGLIKRLTLPSMDETTGKLPNGVTTWRFPSTS